MRPLDKLWLFVAAIAIGLLALGVTYLGRIAIAVEIFTATQ